MRDMSMKEEIYTFYQTRELKDIIRFQICGRTFPDKNYTIFRPPSSEVSCIEYIESGSGIINVGNKTYSATEGDTYFLHGRVTHQYYSDKDNPWQKIFVNVYGSLADSMIDGYGLSDKILFRGLDTSNELNRILEIAKKSSVSYKKDCILILNELFIKMHNHLTSKEQLLPQKIRDYLDKVSLNSKFSFDNLCSEFHLSQSQIIRVFKQHYSMTPYQYFLNKKIMQAEILLKTTALSIKQISYMLNFADEYYFSNVFLKSKGISPSQYRMVYRVM